MRKHKQRKGVESGVRERHGCAMGEQREIDRVASHQYGVISSAQVSRAGFDQNAIHRKLESGAWIRMCSGVYALASAPPKWERQMTAAILSRPRAIAGEDSSAYLHGLNGFGPRKPVIIVPWSSSGRSTIARVVRTVFFNSLGRDRQLGIPTTNVAETLLGVARWVGRAKLELLFDDALAAGKVILEDFDPILDRIEGGRVQGARPFRELVLDRSVNAPQVGSSYLERLLERLLEESDIPDWVREFPFSVRGEPARADFYIPAWRLVVEVDGRRWHTRKADFESDRSRDNELATQGIQVLRFSYQMLKSAPEQCLATIRQTGRVRCAYTFG